MEGGDSHPLFVFFLVGYLRHQMKMGEGQTTKQLDKSPRRSRVMTWHYKRSSDFVHPIWSGKLRNLRAHFFMRMLGNLRCPSILFFLSSLFSLPLFFNLSSPGYPITSLKARLMWSLLIGKVQLVGSGSGMPTLSIT